MFNPGVIFDAGERDWLAFLEGEGFKTDTGVKPIDPSDYNAPSIAIGKLVGSQTVTRRVTAVKPGTYQTDISVPGVTATVTPSILNFSSAGQTKIVKITFTRNAAPLSKAVFGSLKFAGAGTLARLPIAVVPEAADAPSVATPAQGPAGPPELTRSGPASTAASRSPCTVSTSAPAQPGEVSKGGTSAGSSTSLFPQEPRLARVVTAASDSRA